MLAHLVAFGVENKSCGYHILECHAVENHSCDGMEREEPSPRLVNTFVDKVGGERLSPVNHLFVLKRIMYLCIWHRTGIKPYVDEIALTLHWFTTVADKYYVVDIRAVQVYAAVIIFRIVTGNESVVLERIAVHYSGCHRFVYFVIKFLHAANADFVTIFITPYRQRCSPKARTRQVPVVQILQPVAETSAAGRFRLPIDSLVKFHHALLFSCGTYEPAVKRIVEHRLVRTPAVRIVVHVFLYAQSRAGLFHLHADYDVQVFSLVGSILVIFSVDGKLRFICVFHEISRMSTV